MTQTALRIALEGNVLAFASGERLTLPVGFDVHDIDDRFIELWIDDAGTRRGTRIDLDSTYAVATSKIRHYLSWLRCESQRRA